MLTTNNWLSVAPSGVAVAKEHKPGVCVIHVEMDLEDTP
jgi:hypothetical protein